MGIRSMRIHFPEPQPWQLLRASITNGKGIVPINTLDVANHMTVVERIITLCPVNKILAWLEKIVFLLLNNYSLGVF